MALRGLVALAKDSPRRQEAPLGKGRVLVATDVAKPWSSPPS
jgi:hypothetical protein